MHDLLRVILHVMCFMNIYTRNTSKQLSEVRVVAICMKAVIKNDYRLKYSPATYTTSHTLVNLGNNVLKR